MWIWLLAAVVIIFIIYRLLPNIYALRGSIAYEKDGLEAALKMYEKAYNTHRASAAALLNYALLLLRSGKPAEAEWVFNEIVLNPSLVDKKKNAAKQYRCLSYIKQGKLDDALEDCAELLAMYKNSDLYAVAGYAMLLSDKDISEKLDICREAYEYNADKRDIADNYAAALILAKDYQKALEISEDVIKENKYFPEGHYHKALALAGLGRAKEAEAELDFLEECDFSYLTTVTEEDIKAARAEIPHSDKD